VYVEFAEFLSEKVGNAISQLTLKRYKKFTDLLLWHRYLTSSIVIAAQTTNQAALEFSQPCGRLTTSNPGF
jgi:hypothetical protein